MGHNPFGEDAPDWLRVLFSGLIFLPLANLFVGNMFYAGEMEDALARPYSGPPLSAFVLRVPSRVDQPGASYLLVPFFALIATILLAMFLGPVVGDAVMASGASFQVFGAVLLGIIALVVGVGVWTGHRFSVYTKRQRVFSDEFFAALSVAGFSWGKKGYQVAPVDYTGDSYVSLVDSSELTSRWNVTWSGESATLTPVLAEVSSVCFEEKEAPAG